MRVLDVFTELLALGTAWRWGGCECCHCQLQSHASPVRSPQSCWHGCYYRNPKASLIEPAIRGNWPLPFPSPPCASDWSKLKLSPFQLRNVIFSCPASGVGGERVREEVCVECMQSNYFIPHILFWCKNHLSFSMLVIKSFLMNTNKQADNVGVDKIRLWTDSASWQATGWQVFGPLQYMKEETIKPSPVTIGASLGAQTVKNLLVMQETGVGSLGQEDPLEKEMATHSSILAWRIPWTEKSWRTTVHGIAESQTWLSD